MPPLQRIGGRYTLRERIGAGGMGEVWLARDEGPEGYQKTVVIKRMLPAAAQYLDYFRAEARLVAQLPHQNITQVLSFFIDEDGQHNIVMEYVEGTDVEELVFTDRGRLTVPMTAYIAAEVLRGLDFAHSARIDRAPAGLVHRDISPHNILVSYGAEVKVTDFGIAKAELEYRQKTEGNKFRGKLSYAPPEALEEEESAPLDRRADIYAVGVVMREMLTKERVFNGTMWQVLMNVKQGRVQPLRELAPDVSPELESVIGKMMHIDREQRYATAGEARAALVRAVPEWSTADMPLRDFVRHVTKRKVRLTSPFLDGQGHGEPMHLREEGSPVAIPIVKGGPDDSTRLALQAATALGRREPPKVEVDLVETVPAGIHEASTRLRGATAVEDGLREIDIHEAVTQPPERRSRVAAFGYVLVGVGIAFAGSAGVLYAVKKHRRAETQPVAVIEQPETTPVQQPEPTRIPDQSPTPTPEPTPITPPVRTPAPMPAAATPEAKPKHRTRREACTEKENVGWIVVPAGDADVTIDGVYAGHTPLQFTIAPGSHRVTMMNSTTFARTSVQVNVTRCKDAKVTAP